MDHIVGDAGPAGPLRYSQGFAVGREPSIAPPVVLVFRLGYPSAVVGRVAFGPIDSVDLQSLAVAVGDCPGEERSALAQPLFADRDATHAIEAVSSTFGIMAAGFHAVEDFREFRIRAAMDEPHILLELSLPVS